MKFALCHIQPNTLVNDKLCLVLDLLSTKADKDESRQNTPPGNQHFKLPNTLNSF